MRLSRARVQNYRSVKDSGWFDIEHDKTILVGPNEAGKTALLRAIEHVSPGPLVKPFDPLRDYPRSDYWRIQSGEIDPANVPVVTTEFTLSPDDQAAIAEISPNFPDVGFCRQINLDNAASNWLTNAPPFLTIGGLKDSLRALAAHVDSRIPPSTQGETRVLASSSPTQQLNGMLNGRPDQQVVSFDFAEEINEWLDTKVAPFVDWDQGSQTDRLASLRTELAIEVARESILERLHERRPTLVYFSTYTRVTPLLHLQHLADALDAEAIDESDPYNFGNRCLLDLLNFSARELSEMGRSPDPAAGNQEAFETYRVKLDQRDAILNSASLRLTQQIRNVWDPEDTDERDYTLRISADQQYLKVSVMDSIGASIELDQRSEGFQWLVSFFIVFFAQTKGDLHDAILLLDEPGLSLHGLKQRAFRITLNSLSEENQLAFTTHSPFLVGPDELDLVRVVEMAGREEGTKVHTHELVTNPASLLPLQEALGYDLAQNLFAQQRSLVLEGLTDYWYLEALSGLLGVAGLAELSDKIAFVPAGSAGKVVYFATILHAHHLKVAALLDSDAAGENAARQDVLVHKLSQTGILRTKDSYVGPVAAPEIEDLLRDTLIEVGRTECGWDVMVQASSQPTRAIVDIFEAEIGSDFSKYRLAKAFLRWSQSHTSSDLTDTEQLQWATLIGAINSALR
jgi:predicted ATPase